MHTKQSQTHIKFPITENFHSTSHNQTNSSLRISEILWLIIERTIKLLGNK